MSYNRPGTDGNKMSDIIIGRQEKCELVATIYGGVILPRYVWKKDPIDWWIFFMVVMIFISSFMATISVEIFIQAMN